ncbi:MAG: hypothetical protein V8K32_05915 [Candidatus Electrothrix gigas]
MSDFGCSMEYVKGAGLRVCPFYTRMRQHSYLKETPQKPPMHFPGKGCDTGGGLNSTAII